MNKEEFDIEVAKQKAQREANIKEYWNTLKPFKDANDIPNLPRVEKKEWNDFYVPKLVECGAITKDKLVDGTWYYGEYRNSNFGKWDATKNEFGLWRYKFGYMWDNCNHFQDDNGYALFVPLRTITPEEMEELNQIEIEYNKKRESLNK
jgi:hypothetical protein